MEFQQVIESRRSIRNYDETKSVSNEVLEELVSAAVLAPSWKNAQTTRYYCITSKDKCNEFREKCLPEFNGKNCQGAPALIVTSFVKDRAGFEKNGEPNNEVGNGWGFYDAGLANENLVLKAKDLGLETLIMGIRDEKSIRELLDVPEEEIIVAVIAIGYGSKEASMPRRKEVSDIMKMY